MKTYPEYFSSKSIIKLLCKYRIKIARKRHKNHLLRDISLHESTKKLIERNIEEEIDKMLPPRRSWVRFKADKRSKFKNSVDLNLAALFATVLTTHKDVAAGKLYPPIWYLNLQSFILEIQKEIAGVKALKLKTPKTLPKVKEYISGQTICRPISVYSLKEKVIISLTAKYLIGAFDPIFLNCSYAFRAAIHQQPTITHHDAVAKILEYRQLHKTPIWVAECDIEKFYDCINHRLIKSAFSKLAKEALDKGIVVSDKAKEIFLKYLKSYTFNHDVYTLNSDQDYFKSHNIRNGYFKWPEAKLEEKYYPKGEKKYKLGVPQGGAISCFIANLILHRVDKMVLSNVKDDKLLYLRYCDDMVILHTDKTKCEAVLKRYLKGIKQIKLLAHEPKSIDSYDKEFWETKSKAPYRWANKKLSAGNVPWLAFVGYQMRYDGVVRVRKNSLETEIQKQVLKTDEVLRAINAKDKANLNLNSRKSTRQQIYALESRLISMSVGRVNLQNYDKIAPSFCWTNGFRHLTYNAVARTQFKILDRGRAAQVKRLRKELSDLKRKSDNGNEKLKAVRYFGYPFSYYSFLKHKA